MKMKEIRLGVEGKTREENRGRKAPHGKSTMIEGMKERRGRRREEERARKRQQS